MTHFDDRGVVGPSMPATPIQTAYVIGSDPAQPLGGQHCLGYVEFGGRRLDVEALGRAVQVLRRHPSLRSALPDSSCLVDIDLEPPALVVNDLRETGDVQAALEQVRQRLIHFPVDLPAGRTWSVEASLLPDGTTSVHLLASLIVTDLAGIGRMAADLAAGLAEPETPLLHHDVDELLAALPEHSVRDDLSAPDPRRERLLAAPELPSAIENAEPETDRLQRRVLDADWRRIGAYARGLRVAPTALVLGVFEECLRRWSAHDEFVVTVTGVDTRGTEDHVADRTRTFAHRSLPADDLAELAGEAGRELRHRLARGVEATEELREALASGEHEGLSPYVFTHAPAVPLFPANVTAVLGEVTAVRSSTPQVIIDCQIIRFVEEGVDISFDVRRGVLEPGVAEAVFNSFLASLYAIADADPQQPLDLALIAPLPPETVAARAAVNAVPRAGDGLLHEPFLAQAGRTPQATALVWDPAAHPGQPQGSMTYAELTAAARRLAGQIHATVDPGSVVGVRLPKGPEQIVAVLAVLIAGCTYLPLGVDQPDERVGRIRDAASMALLVDADFLVETRQVAVEPLDPIEMDPEHLAYIVYTSGSTGEPKGVAIRHHSAANTVADVNARNGIGPTDRTLAVSALDFDLSVYDIFGPLSVGGAVVLIDEGARRDAFSWVELVQQHSVTVWNTVPSLAEMLCVAADRPLDLRRVMCSGDWIDLGLPARLNKIAPQAVLVAMGGATEASIWSNEYLVHGPDDLDSQWSSIPYGVPLAGQRYRVADARGRDCPDWVAGELWIGGVGVAAGYHGAPELTAERFVEVDGECWYRTGDLGLWNPGPLLVFLGRCDTQVKVRGHRIECGEVESKLRQLPGVQDAAVVPIRDRSALGAVLIAEPGTESSRLAAGEISRSLGARLPGYMVPAVITTVERLQLTANGKVDRRWAVQTCEGTVTPGPVVTQGPVAAEWAAVLGTGTLDPEQNFFSAGGDSLMATELCSRLRRRGYAVTVSHLFADPQLGDFDRVCRSLLDAAGPADADVAACETGAGDGSIPTDLTPFPLTPLQRAYALGADGMRGVVQTVPLFATVLQTEDGSPVDLERLTMITTDLVAELEVLRCVRIDETRQQVCPAAEVQLRRVDDLYAALAEPDLDLDRAPVLELLHDARDDRVGVRFGYLMLDARSLAGVLACLLDDLAVLTGDVDRVDVRGC